MRKYFNTPRSLRVLCASAVKNNYALRITDYALGVPIVLALIAGVSRLLLIKETPINWDAVQFALALDKFDLHAHQPHPPGYILYVLAGRALNLLVGSPALSLAFLSASCSAMLVPLIYWLALGIFEDRSVALGAAFLALSSPLAFYYGSAGLTYLPEMLLSVCIAGLAWRAKLLVIGTHLQHDAENQPEQCHSERSEESRNLPQRSISRFFAALRMTIQSGFAKPGSDISPGYMALLLGVALGIAGGVRQTSLLVLLPTCLWALWGTNRRTGALFVGSLLVTCALWLLPLLIMAGGIEPYLKESALLAQVASDRTSILTAGVEGLAYNLSAEGMGLILGLGFGAIPLGVWASRRVRFSLALTLRAFLMWWTLPPLLLYAVSHVGQYGYMLVVLPPLILLSALCTTILAHKLTHRQATNPERWALFASGALSLLSAGYFLLADGPTTLSNIDRNHAHWQELRRVLSHMDPTSTALIMSVEWSGPFRLAGYLLPEFHAYAAADSPTHPVGWLYSAYGGHSDYALPHPQPQSYLSLPPGTTRVVALDTSTGAMLAAEKGLHRVSLQDGSTLYILDPLSAPIKGLTIHEGAIRVVDDRR